MPAHEAMQPPHAGHQVGARAQIEVIGIGQDERCPQLAQVGRGHGFDCGRRAHRGKDRGGDVAVGGVHQSHTGGAAVIFVDEVEGKSHRGQL